MLKLNLFPSMTGSAKNMVEQFIEFRGAKYNKSAIESAQESLLSTVTRLENEGRFHLRDKIKGGSA